MPSNNTDILTKLQALYNKSSFDNNNYTAICIQEAIFEIYSLRNKLEMIMDVVKAMKTELEGFNEETENL